MFILLNYKITTKVKVSKSVIFSVMIKCKDVTCNGVVVSVTCNGVTCNDRVTVTPNEF